MLEYALHRGRQDFPLPVPGGQMLARFLLSWLFNIDTRQLGYKVKMLEYASHKGRQDYLLVLNVSGGSNARTLVHFLLDI